ncbi:hypothetical protein O6H91_04G122600 [Diphasiastrum complanatum]|uniref:Uncharacterized protein n=2 Tax=Diphasiastrum complanatum TaxID=34168 RepID=A0ACC2AM67_DIPCM|nr:hypothetical protein O6H91_20G001700 [Diphasiastrum complanatum]KAJ7560297.1 hypothetical protein O6H91_04G122600 [Diphasiastrum complanatum]
MSKTNRVQPSSPPQVDLVKQVAISTTFVQAAKESFREVVQKYTGAGDDAQGKLPVTCKPVGVTNGGKAGSEVLSRKPMHKLHERRQKGGKEMKLEIKNNPFLFKRNGASPRGSEGLSPTFHDHLLPPLLSSPVTPLSALSLDSSPRTPADQLPPSVSFIRDENKVHILDRSSIFAPPVLPRKTEPELLNLFPLTSPRMSQI